MVVGNGKIIDCEKGGMAAVVVVAVAVVVYRDSVSMVSMVSLSGANENHNASDGVGTVVVATVVEVNE